jgi:XTP/dITP diphosphohydrolase
LVKTNIVFASSNAGKIKELQALLSAFDLHVIPQKELDVGDAPETGLTFVENALIKARHACEQTGFPAIADDSGLVVSALQGAPGIYSARYGGEAASAQDNINKLLSELKDVPQAHRGAFFYCTLVYLEHAKDPTPIICHGKWHGIILEKPTGEKGFGYDPVFFDAHLNCSAAELPIALKNQVSHRGQALRQLVEQLQKAREK